MENYIYITAILILFTAVIVLFAQNNKLSKELNGIKDVSNAHLRTKEIEHLTSDKDKEINTSEIISALKIKNKDEINELKEIHRSELKKEFDEGFVKGVEISKIEVRVTPIRRAKIERNMLSKKEVLEIGFSYRLFSNGIPCLEPHVEIVESVYKKELNEENVNLIAAKIESAISKIPNTNLILTESISSFANKLIDKKSIDKK